MTENSSREILDGREEVLSTINASFGEKFSLEDDVRQLKSHATVSSHQPKKQCGKDKDICNIVPCTGSHDNNENIVDASLNNKTALSFSIQVEKTCTRQPPKRLLAKTRVKRSATFEDLNKKQEQAEERRKQQRENRLQRIHDRQEAARKLALNVDILLQQRALAMGATKSDVKPLPTRQIMATAHHVAQNFRDLTNQLDKDLSFDKKLDTKIQANPSCTRNEIRHETRKDPQKRQSTSQSQSVWFTIEVDGNGSKAKSQKPDLSARRKKALTAEDIAEKQRKAEERRNERQERRIKNARESRKALMNMAKDIERFKSLQEVMESSPSSVKCSKESAVLAEKIADGFDRLSQRYNEDLKRAENFYIEQPYIVRQ